MNELEPKTETPAHHDTGESVRRQRRPGDIVNKNTANLPDDQRIPIRWLHAYGDEQDLSNERLGELIGYSKSSISRIYGEALTFEGNLDKFCDAINELRRKVDGARNTGGDRRVPFQQTSLAKHIFKLGKLARQHRRIAYCFGDTQIGKSRITTELAATNKGSAVRFEMPVGASLHSFMANAAEAMRMSSQKKVGELRRRIIDFADSEQLIIVDQMHRCFTNARGEMADELSGMQLRTLDFIIEIFDGHEPGMLLVGSNVFRDGISTVAHKNFFRQLRGRSLHPDGFQLPSKPTKADLNMFSGYYGLPPATGAALELQDQIINAPGWGLAVWLTRLSSASKRAEKRGVRMEWTDVIRAHDLFTKIGKYEIEEAA